ncbi:MAG: hypothetical protein U5R31_01305 [Acidimicrobiia bacterium]|nr:hypothetical protein [Acidimicrobiia bacterium]
MARQALAAFLYRLATWRLLDPATADRCDFLDPAHCLLTWPTDHLTPSPHPSVLGPPPRRHGCG